MIVKNEILQLFDGLFSVLRGCHFDEAISLRLLSTLFPDYYHALYLRGHGFENFLDLLLSS